MLFRSGEFGDLIGAMANRPPIMRHTFSMLLDLRDEDVLPRRYLELAIVVVSRLNACTYCISHHTPNLAHLGISDEAADRILDYASIDEFDEVDKLVIEYAIAVTQQWNQVRDAMFDRLRQHFDDAQITELTWRIALTGAFNRFNDVLQTQNEAGVETLSVTEAAAIRASVGCARPWEGVSGLTDHPLDLGADMT